MNKHCKGCVYHVSAGRRKPTKEQEKYNDWCCKKGSQADVGWCKTHGVKKLKDQAS